MDILSENRNICFEADIKNELVTSEIACNWRMKYYSVIGSGKAYFIEDIDGKKEAMDIIMRKYSENDAKSFKYSETALNKTAVIKVEITEITGKKSEY